MQEDPLVTAAQDVLSILHIGLNSTDHHNARIVAAKLLPQINDTAVLVPLLQTAATRHHIEVVRFAAELEAVKGLAPAAVLQLMQTAAEACSDVNYGKQLRDEKSSTFGHMWRQPGYCIMGHLVRLPAAAALTNADLVSLLQTAVGHGNKTSICGHTAEALCVLPQASHLNSEELLQILQTALTSCCDAGIRTLCSFPAAANFTVVDMVHLLQTAIRATCSTGLNPLCTLQAAKQITMDQWISLMQSAAVRGLSTAAQDLCSLPAASQIAVHSWSDLLSQSMAGPQGVESSHVAASRRVVSQNAGTARLASNNWSPLCRLPAAASAAVEVIRELLAVGIAHDRPAEVEALCSLPAAANISQQQTLGLVKKAVFTAATSSKPNHAGDIFLAMHRLLGAVQNMTAVELFGLLEILVQHSCSDAAVFGWLAKLDAARNVSADSMVQLLQAAIKRLSPDLLQALCRFPAAASLDVDAVLLLFRAVVAEDSNAISRSMQQHLCALPAAAKLDSSLLMSLLLDVISSDHIFVKELLCVPAARQLNSDNMVDLLLAAIKRDNVINVKKLCSVQPARCLSQDNITELLFATVATDSSLMISTLCDLDFAQQLDASDLQTVFETALQQGSGNSVRILCSLPAARDIDVDDLLADLSDAIKIHIVVAVHSLCQLPKAADINSQSALQLLQTAVQMHSSSMITSLGQLPAVKQLPAEALTELITVAEQQGGQQVVKALMRLLEATAAVVVDKQV